MRFSKIFKFSLLVIVAVALVGCSATPTRRSFKEGWKDGYVSTKVKYKLTKDKLVKKRNINVDVWRGVVTLTGRVTSPEEKERAEQLSWQIKGVRGVENYLNMADGMSTNEAIAEETFTEKDITTVATKNTGTTTKTGGNTGTKVITVEEDTTTKVATKAKPANPVKSQVSKKVDGPVVYEEKTKTKTKTEEKMTATRGDSEQYMSTEIKEDDLSSEESLAREAAEELKRLRGE